jgi:adenylate kinase
MKHVILITGTPCIGKTTVATALAAKLNAEYINLTDYAKAHGLIKGQDSERDTLIIDEEGMRQSLAETIDNTINQTIIIDGHYAPAVVPKQVVAYVFVLRRNPKELKELMEKRGYNGNKLWENLQAEILDACLIEAVQTHSGKVCELDATNKPTETVVAEILDTLEKQKACTVGTMDWMNTLEKEGLLDEFLRT